MVQRTSESSIDTASPYLRPNDLSEKDKAFALLCIAFLCQLTSFILSVSLAKFIGGGIPLWWLHAAYLAVSVGATCTHMAGHFHWSGRWFRAHTFEHHSKLYPAKRFLNEKQLFAEDGNSKYYLPTIFVPAVITYFIFSDVIAGVVTLFFIGGWMELVDEMHAYYHLKGHWMEKYKWFQVLRDIHYGHHTGSMLQNFGILDFFIDCILGNLALG